MIGDSESNTTNIREEVKVYPGKIKFNDKFYFVEDMKRSYMKGISIEIEASEDIIKHTVEHMGDQLVYEGDEIIVYLYKGNYVVLIGLDTYRKAVTKGIKQIKVRLFNKHTISTFEDKPELPEPPPETYNYGYSNDRSRPYGGYNQPRTPGPRDYVKRNYNR